jgi:hypothetical protein
MTSSSTPELRATYAAPQSHIDELALLGHTVVRGLASPDEVAAFRPAIESAVLRATRHLRPIESRDTYGKAFLQVPNLCVTDDVVRAFTFAPRFARVAAELLQVDGVRLYHDQALFKEPGGGHTPWHQDQVYWPLDNDKCVTMWMPLVDVPSAVGSMTFADGSHLHGDLGHGIIGDQSEAGFAALVRDDALPTSTHGAMRAGDATFHMGWTLHRADANPTGLLRSVMTVIYIADGTRVGEIDSPARRLDQAIWLGGAAPGSLVDGPGNPLLWPVEE